MPYDQAKTMRSQPYTDQFGRSWVAEIDLKSGEPVGPLRPRFSAPIIPPQKYISTVRGEYGKVRVDYERWLADVKQAQAEFQREQLKHAQRLFSDKAAEAIRDRVPALMEAVGIEPEPYQPIEACVKGNKWALGLVDESKMPAWAEPYFVKKQKETVEYPDVEYDDAPAKGSKPKAA